jgi:hypothetical protein
MRDASPICASHSGGTTCCMPFESCGLAVEANTRRRMRSSHPLPRVALTVPFRLTPASRHRLTNPGRSGKVSNAEVSITSARCFRTSARGSFLSR